MEELVNKEDFIRATKLKKFKLGAVAGPLMKLTGIDGINQLYDSVHDSPGLEVSERLLQNMNIKIRIDESELEHIPRTGAFIVVSNHPFGAVDGIAMLKIMLAIRPDFKLMGNFLLHYIKPMRDSIIAVNPFESPDVQVSSMAGMRQALAQVMEGHPLGMFPSGEVSSIQSLGRGITDRAWQKPAIKLIKKAGVPVIPLYFKGSNSPLFHLLGLLHPSLRTISLPKELLRKKHTELVVRIGNPISPKELEEFTDLDQLGRFLRAKTYALGSALKVKDFFRPRLLLNRRPKEIVKITPVELIEEEIQALPPEAKLCSQQNFDVFVADSVQIPHILHELGRLREITFRSVGEGTNRELDLDEYDLYYYHLFLWDREAKRIAGAYRLGKGQQIIDKYGKKGFYTHNFFRFKKELIPVLRQTIELGRSFVVQDYQKHRLSLFLLWKGIMAFYTRYPEYRYLLGPVSISNDYSSASKNFMVAYLKKFYLDEEKAALVRARLPFQEKLNDEELRFLVEISKSDLRKTDKIVEDIEPLHFRMPVLLKKYIAQNAKVLAFNIDPDFNFSLDGLMIIDLQHVPADTIRNLSKEPEA